MNKIRIIARGSRLSRIQVSEVMNRLPGVDYEVRFVESLGDKKLNISLLNGEAPADIFTRELDMALIHDEADVAIHSAKDLPDILSPQLEIVALYPPFDVTDSLVSRDHLTLDQLPPGSVVGTSSPLRKQGLEQLRPDLVVKGIRGCIEDRVRQVKEGKYDAAIVATCALKRLGLDDCISEVLPFATHPLQGYLAVTARKSEHIDRLRLLFGNDNLIVANHVLYTGTELPANYQQEPVRIAEPWYTHTPLIEIDAQPYQAALAKVGAYIRDYHYLLFTSRYAVHSLIAAGVHVDAEKTQIVAIGLATSKALSENNMPQHVRVKKDDSFGVIDFFRDKPRGKVLIPRSNLALDIIPDGLSSLGFDVTTITAYQNRLPENPHKVDLDLYGQIEFTSPSTIDNFVSVYGTLPQDKRLITRGQITESHLRKVMGHHFGKEQ